MRTSGVYRVEAVMKYLPEHGFAPKVVTLPNDWMSFTAKEDYSGIDVPALQPTHWADGLIRAISEVRFARWVQREALIPDLLTFWARSAARQVASQLNDVELVYATSPPYSDMIAAQLLADELGVPCVQELRDPPSFHRAMRGRSERFARRMLAFEREYLTRADHVIAVTPRTRSRFLDLHSELDPDRVHVVTNGYPDIEVDPGLSGRDRSKFTVAYVGTFQGSVKARSSSVFTPAVLMDGLAALPSDQVSLRLVGKVSPQQRQSIRKLDRGGVVDFVGQIERAAALAEVAAADVAAILADDDDWWIGRKAFEYLRYAHTILAVVPPGDTTDLLSRHSRVDVISPNDLSSLPVVFKRRFEEWSAGNWERGSVAGEIQSDRSCVAGIAAVLDAALARN